MLPIYAVGEGVAALAYLLDAPAALADSAAEGVGHGVEAVLGEGLQRLNVRGELPALRHLYIEHYDVQLAGGGHPGVLLAHGAGGGVARVGQQLLAAPGAPLVQLLEHGAGHVDLAAHNQPRRKLTAQALRQAAHGAQVLRHVLAGNAVAAGGAADENAVFVLQGHGEAVYLGLHAVLAPLGQGGEHALVKGRELIEGEHVRQALQRHLVAHGLKAALGGAADVLGGGGGVVELRVRGLQLLQAAHERVVLEVGYHGGVLVVVVAVVLAYLGPQGLYLLFNVHFYCSMSR